MVDFDPSKQIPPGIPLSCNYDVLTDSQITQEGLARVNNLTINRPMKIVIMAQIIRENVVVKEDTQFSVLGTLGNNDSTALKFRFNVDDLEDGPYQIIISTWPKGHKEDMADCIGNNFTIGDVQ